MAKSSRTVPVHLALRQILKAIQNYDTRCKLVFSLTFRFHHFHLKLGPWKTFWRYSDGIRILTKLLILQVLRPYSAIVIRITTHSHLFASHPKRRLYRFGSKLRIRVMCLPPKALDFKQQGLQKPSSSELVIFDSHCPGHPDSLIIGKNTLSNLERDHILTLINVYVKYHFDELLLRSRIHLVLHPRTYNNLVEYFGNDVFYSHTAWDGLIIYNGLEDLASKFDLMGFTSILCHAGSLYSSFMVDPTLKDKTTYVPINKSWLGWLKNQCSGGSTIENLRRNYLKIEGVFEGVEIVDKNDRI